MRSRILEKVYSRKPKIEEEKKAKKMCLVCNIYDQAHIHGRWVTMDVPSRRCWPPLQFNTGWVFLFCRFVQHLKVLSGPIYTVQIFNRDFIKQRSFVMVLFSGVIGHRRFRPADVYPIVQLLVVDPHTHARTFYAPTINIYT